MNIKFSRYDTTTQTVDYVPTDVLGGATYTDVSTGGDGKLHAVDSVDDIDLAADGRFLFCGNGKLVIGQLGDPQVITKTLPFQTAFCSFGYVPR